MWAIVKFDKKKFDFFKRELTTKLGKNQLDTVDESAVLAK